MSKGMIRDFNPQVQYHTLYFYLIYLKKGTFENVTQNGCPNKRGSLTSSPNSTLIITKQGRRKLLQSEFVRPI